jgi:hypothetical protein
MAIGECNAIKKLGFGQLELTFDSELAIAFEASYKPVSDQSTDVDNSLPTSAFPVT